MQNSLAICGGNAEAASTSRVEVEKVLLDFDTELLAKERDYFLSSSFRTIQAPAGLSRL